MEATATIRKLKLNKKTISTLNTSKVTNETTTYGNDECRYTVNCTFPECGSAPWCRTDHYQSCAPCVPPKGDPLPTSKKCL